MKYYSQGDIFGPAQTTIKNILLNTLWGFVAGIIGTILITIIYVGATALDSSKLINQTLLPFIASFITFMLSVIINFFTYTMLCLFNPNKYKKNRLIFLQLGIIYFITYLIFIPIYLYIGTKHSEHLTYLFAFQIIFLAGITSIITEVLNNYRYVLTGIFGTIFGSIFASFLAYLLFTLFPSQQATYISMLAIPPIVNATLIFFKTSFEFLYYRYYLATGHDNMGDIFKQIEEEEAEALREAEDNIGF